MTKPNKSVLLVDEDDAFRMPLSDRLKEEKITVLEAHDGEEGLRVAIEKMPSLILLDISMPRMDGLTMLKKLREDKWGANAQVVLLTNLSDNAPIAASLEKGVFDYLVKTDWTMEELAKKVKEKLGISSKNTAKNN
ncbi:MAG TPA: response regulator [Candidatus Paceibacterota bacterium]